MRRGWRDWVGFGSDLGAGSSAGSTHLPPTKWSVPVGPELACCGVPGTSPRDCWALRGPPHLEFGNSSSHSRTAAAPGLLSSRCWPWPPRSCPGLGASGRPPSGAPRGLAPSPVGPRSQPGRRWWRSASDARPGGSARSAGPRRGLLGGTSACGHGAHSCPGKGGEGFGGGRGLQDIGLKGL